MNNTWSCCMYTYLMFPTTFLNNFWITRVDGMINGDVGLNKIEITRYMIIYQNETRNKLNKLSMMDLIPNCMSFENK